MYGATLPPGSKHIKRAAFAKLLWEWNEQSKFSFATEFMTVGIVGVTPSMTTGEHAGRSFAKRNGRFFRRFGILS
jgi:hypothetical protein